MEFDDLLADHKSETSTRNLSGFWIVRSEERCKQLFLILNRDANTFICNLDDAALVIS